MAIGHREKTGMSQCMNLVDIFIEGSTSIFWSITSANAQNAFFYPNQNLVAGIIPPDVMEACQDIKILKM